jgi:hypothetical protein
LNVAVGIIQSSLRGSLPVQHNQTLQKTAGSESLEGRRRCE